MRTLKLFFVTLLLFCTNSLCFANDKAILLDVNGPIGPATQDYITRGLAHAKEQHAKLVILQLNTPGGLETSMRGISEAIVTSPIPVAVYVAPPGARAASAGTYILYAAHIAAMAPGTNVGAATPISLMGSSSDYTKKGLSTEEKKARNDAAAYLYSLAELRGRNTDWTKHAVNDSASISAEEAKKTHVIDTIANDVPELLQKVDGQEVTVNKTKEKLDTKNLTIETLATDWRYDFLSFITNPNIAYLLLLLAMYGIFFELSNPGFILPGVAGVIALLLVLYAFQLLPINYTGLMLIIVGIGFIVLELFITSYGVLGIGGAIAFIIGSIMLFDMQSPGFQLIVPLVASMSLVTALFILTILTMTIRSHKRAVVTGKEGLIGSKGEVLNTMNEQVIVRVLGEIWEARSNHPLKSGQKVVVTKIHGLILKVEPIKD